MRLIDQAFVGTRVLAAMRSQWWSAERIAVHQERALTRILQHAVQTVPFYRRLGIKAGSISGVGDLERFPIVCKADIQRDPSAFLADGFEPSRLHASRTSGSSGQPTVTYFDREAWLLSKYAFKMRRVAATAGFPLRQRVLIVSESAPAALDRVADAAPGGYGLFYQVQYVSIHEPTASHLDRIAAFRPHVIYAFPSYLLDLAMTAAERGTSLPKVPTLCTSSEVLTAGARDRIEAAFGGRLHDVYGSTEFKEVAWQCHHARYHLNFENVFIEPQPPGGVRPVILSTLCNRAMPLLRFDIGDQAIFAHAACPCGRSSPQFEDFVGRDGEMMTLPSGRRMSPYILTTAIEAEESILQYQIVESAPGILRLDVVVRTPGVSATWEARVLLTLGKLLGEGVSVTVRELDALPMYPSGKRSVFQRSADAELAGTTSEY